MIAYSTIIFFHFFYYDTLKHDETVIRPTILYTFIDIMYALLARPPPRGCAGGRIGTRFLRPRGTSSLKGANPAGTLGYRNGTESFGLKGHPSVAWDV